jgi:hypothetical protein
MGRAVDRPEWAKALAADLAERNNISGTVGPTLSPEEVAELVALVRSGSLEERDTALRFLTPIVRSNDQTAQGLLPQDWQAGVWELFRKHPWTPAGSLAWNLLLQIDRNAVNAVLMGMPVEPLSDAERKRLIGHLRHADQPKVFGKLREIEALGGEAGVEARRTRENLGGIDPENLELIASEWRARRARDSLIRLYDTYVIHLPIGSSVERLLGLLGTPSHHSPHDYRWDTDEDGPIQLAVFTDADERLEAFKLK